MAQSSQNKLYSLVNIVGLTTGINCCLLIGLYLQNETSYDRFHKNAGRIVRTTCLPWSFCACCLYYRTESKGNWIRKILGAGVRGIVLLISQDFIRLVVIASLIAFPLAWFSANSWLDQFAYRIQINWFVFFIAGTTATFIALASIIFQALRAAIMNPVKSLHAD